MSGKVECGEKVSSVQVGNFSTNLVIVGWAIKSITQRKFCGGFGDVACTAIPLWLLESENKEVQKLGAVLAVANLGRITYDLIPRSRRVV